VRLPPLNALQVFEAAARHRSFTRAAEELHITQGAVSHRIRALEDSLGRPLFRRLGRSVDLSEAGAAYLPVVQGAFTLLTEGTDRVFAAADSDVLTVTLPPAFAMQWLIPRLGAFQAANPETEVRLSTTLRVLDLSREGVDVGIRYGRGDWPGLRCDRLFAYDLMPVCSPDLRDRSEPLRTPADLARHTLLHCVTEPDDWRLWLDAAGISGVDPDKGPRFDTTALTLSAAYAGLGIAIAPHAYVDEDIGEGWLVAPFEIAFAFGEAFYLVAPEAADDRPQITAFRDWLLAEAADQNARQRARR
jgi:LysR family glycine cleavage system transcriptional activator